MRKLLLLAAAASILILAAPAVAQAAATPSAKFSFTNESVASGVQPQLSYQTHGLPTASWISLQFRKSGSGRPWAYAKTLPRPGGTTTALALPAGLYQFRMRVLSADKTVVISAWRYLDITTSTKSCGACQVTGQAIGVIISWILGHL
jgi:hypothetical protein